MSANPMNTAHVDHDGSNHYHDAHGHDGSHNHGSRKSYLIGFGLSVLLTVIPFWLVMSGPLSSGVTAMAIMAFAFVQIIVHMVYFLHMDSKSEGGWTLMALIFTVVVVVITLSGSLWVMYHMNTNMMPAEAMSEMR